MNSAYAMSPWQVMVEPVRAYLIELLCVCEATSGELAMMAYERFGIGWPTVSRHLRTLSASGFVDCVCDDPTRWYFLADDWLDIPTRAVADLHAQWEAGAETRELGGVLLLEVAPRAEGVPSRRGLRGRLSETTARWGRGRAQPTDEVDGGFPE